jgi:hypothetical protein
LLGFALFCGGGCFDCFDKIINWINNTT